ncbi:hypothetical protein J1792_16325 [Streptomyces triculaminicus]|uniref:Uncharacterized protein n=1 Tax=Streptomyces triculaminicus TaxID=2816232 RepID=A0A939JR06_9ACTN|nr:hypothetical protein [Streptomyces triculaminicus]MBO0654282.1 hypothetical protein [Streptomyces triculaminicus]
MTRALRRESRARTVFDSWNHALTSPYNRRWAAETHPRSLRRTTPPVGRVARSPSGLGPFAATRAWARRGAGSDWKYRRLGSRRASSRKSRHMSRP